MRCEILFLLALAAAVLPAAVLGMGCYEEGECSGGTLLGYAGAATPEDCSMECGDQQGCQYFTHFKTRETCLLYDSCPVLDAGCGDCVSGRTGCTSCFETGLCDGDVIKSEFTDDEFACLEECRAKPGCSWITYISQHGICLLMEDCPNVDGSYEDDISAPTACSNSTEEDPLNILVATGWFSLNAGDYTDDVEIVNIESGNSSCLKPPDYPLRLYNAAGTFFGGKARICGGDFGGYVVDGVNNGLTSDCYEYSPGDKEWTLSDYSLSEGRWFHEGFLLANGSWLIVGGFGGKSGYTTDIYSEGVMQKGPDLPGDFVYPVGTVINSTHIFLAGARNEYNASYLVDVGTWEFTRLPDMAEKRRIFFCGTVENKHGERELVVAGGYDRWYYYDTSEIFNFGTWSWREGPRLPYPVSRAEAVQMSETFVAVGGCKSEGLCEHLGTVYEFDNVNYEWILREGRLEIPRRDFVAIPLPSDWDVCS